MDCGQRETVTTPGAAQKSALILLHRDTRFLAGQGAERIGFLARLRGLQGPGFGGFRVYSLFRVQGSGFRARVQDLLVTVELLRIHIQRQREREREQKEREREKERHREREKKTESRREQER